MNKVLKPLQLKPAVLVIAAAIMLGSVAVASILKPDHYWADHIGAPDYETVIPQRFGDWEALPYATSRVVNPVQEESLKRLYSQTFARSFMHKPTGRVLMLSIAYGRDQSNDTQLHTPEQCYPAQGFKVMERLDVSVPSAFGEIKSVQMKTYMGTDRVEPLTYFVRVGDQVARGSRERNLTRINMALKGYLVDGTLVRVSEVTRRDDAHRMQEQFIADLVSALKGDDRRYVIGMPEA